MLTLSFQTTKAPTERNKPAGFHYEDAVFPVRLELVYFLDINFYYFR
jgi:hypothetical protein